MKDCYSGGSYGHLDCSFDNPARKLLPEGQNFARCPKNMEKKRERFNFFSSFCSCGLVIGGFDDRAKMFLSKIWKTFLRCEIDWKVRTLILIFQQKVKETLKKPVLSTQLKSSFQKTTIFFAQCSKMTRKKKILSQKTVSFQNVFTDTKRAVLKTSPGNIQRQAVFFCSMSGKYKKKDLI